MTRLVDRWAHRSALELTQGVALLVFWWLQVMVTVVGAVSDTAVVSETLATNDPGPRAPATQMFELDPPVRRGR
jgi:hypothetical protein